MLVETAIVLSTDGPMAEVQAQARSACGGCAAKGACGTSLLDSLFPERRPRFWARNDPGARPGDRVRVGLAESALQRASLMLYLLPLFGLIGGALLGRQLMPHSEGASILLGVIGLAAVLGWVRRHSRKLWKRGEFQAVILEILPAPGAVVTLDPGTLDDP